MTAGSRAIARLLNDYPGLFGGGAFRKIREVTFPMCPIWVLSENTFFSILPGVQSESGKLARPPQLPNDRLTKVEKHRFPQTPCFRYDRAILGFRAEDGQQSQAIQMYISTKPV